MLRPCDTAKERETILIVVGLLVLAMAVLVIEAVRGNLHASDIPKLVAVGLLGYLSRAGDRRDERGPDADSQ